MEALRGLIFVAVVGAIAYAIISSDDGVETDTSTVDGLEQHTENVI